MPYPTLFQPEPSFTDWDLRGLFQAPAHLFSGLDSTNAWMKENAPQLLHGSLVLADTQTGGRGRFQRIWRSPAGNGLYLSLFLRPKDLPLWQWPHLTQIAAITLADLLISIGCDVQVKWPNDLLHNSHKFCGILSERMGSGDQAGLVLGMGINVNNPLEDFAGLDRKATSLSMMMGHSLNRMELVKLFLENFQLALGRFAQEGIEPWLKQWRSMPNFVGSRARLVQSETIREGVVMGIQSDGGLLFLADGNSTPEPVYSGDLEV